MLVFAATKNKKSVKRTLVHAKFEDILTILIYSFEVRIKRGRVRKPRDCVCPGGVAFGRQINGLLGIHNGQNDQV